MYLADQPNSARPDQRMLEGRRVLVVEDDAIICMLIEEELTNAGAEVVDYACSVKKALEQLDQAIANGGLSAAVLDIDLNGEMVFPVADRLAALSVPFIFVTGYPKWYTRAYTRLHRAC